MDQRSLRPKELTVWDPLGGRDSLGSRPSRIANV